MKREKSENNIKKFIDYYSAGYAGIDDLWIDEDDKDKNEEFELYWRNV